ncbi:DinB family protein [Micromonospora sp. NPDC092111]|uniref:DinB family protein n=1 Tax=Micromonospora sp. NPDC092111 TaxID=3364289 RepID=UPI003809FAC9
MTTTRPLDSEELASTAPEREVLEAFVDAYRDEIVGKVRGLSEEDARRSLVPSLTTLVGLVSHAAAVERNWFQHCLAQQPRAQIVGNSFGDDASWQVGPDETVAGVIAEYATACERSRQIAAGFALDDTVPHPRLGRVSLRYIYVHMIRELARHCGHADILREQIDSMTGD